MKRPDHDNFESHSEALQLPLYVAGMLDQLEREELEQHITECPTCQKELEAERRLQPAIQKALETWPSPSQQVLQRAKDKIAQIPRPQESERGQALEVLQGWGAKIEAWIRGLFTPRWVPTFAIFVILIQGAFLQLLLTSPSTSRPPGMEGPIFERELPPPTEGTARIQRFQIQFTHELSVRALQGLLKKVQGTIILGPGFDDEFVIELRYSHPAQLEKNLQTLNTMKTVTMVKPLDPS